MKEINVKDYVQIKGGIIGQVKNINDFRPPEAMYAVEIGLEDLVFLGENDILKHTPNLDLLYIINKAIKFVEKSMTCESDYDDGDFEGCRYQRDLLKILKGE